MILDGQLYKQAGNAVTVPLMKLIGSKIKIALESKYSSSLTKFKLVGLPFLYSPLSAHKVMSNEEFF